MESTSSKARKSTGISWLFILIVAFLLIVPFKYYTEDDYTVLINPITYRYCICNMKSGETLKGIASCVEDCANYADNNDKYIFSSLQVVNCDDFHFGLFESDWWLAVILSLYR